LFFEIKKLGAEGAKNKREPALHGVARILLINH
jgi:hypothetical protein